MATEHLTQLVPPPLPQQQQQHSVLTLELGNPSQQPGEVFSPMDTVSNFKE